MRKLTTLFCLLVALFAFQSGAIDTPHKVTFGDERIETDHWAVELSPGSDPFEIAERHGHEFVGKVGDFEGIYLFKKKSDTVHGVTHPHHETSLEIKWHERQIARNHTKRALSDPLFPSQWHLHQTGSMGNVHINVAAAWNKGITGEGVVIAIVDDGLEYTHADIADNYKAGSSWDFNYNDNNPFPDNSYDDHGTPAGGVAAARDNTVCGVGSAYRAGLAGLRLLGKASTDVEEGGALSYKPNENHIYSNSWGPTDDGRRKEGPGRLATLALETGITQGRNGKGSIYMWAAGNGKRSGDNCNYDGWANSRYTISIGAVDYKGIQAWYSEDCAMLVAVAPSSGSNYAISTTDLKGSRGTTGNDCTSSFGGTSAAAPLAAGVTALILQANPNLSWRDVQGVFIESSRVTDEHDSDWVLNGGGHMVNHKYGFGLIDAGAAVEKASKWRELGRVISQDVALAPEADIPDNSVTGVTVSFNVDIDFTVEHVEIQFVSNHRRRGDLHIVLTSPFGTRSTLAEHHADNNANYNWRFGSIRHWGESSKGEWKLTVSDETPNNTGKINSVTLSVYGH